MATTQPVHVPAPAGGLNTVAPASAMPPGDAVYCYNLVGSEQGMRVRLGHREWCTGLTGGTTNAVPSLLPFHAANPVNNKLFGVTASGIWDCTASSAAPSQSLIFGVQGGDAGTGIWHAMSTVAGHFLLYTDEANGYHVWSESGAAWTAITEGVGASQVSGFNPANASFATVFKNRVFLVEKGTSKAWFGDVNAIYGTFVAFDFGPRFRAGGELVGLYNWSYDAGNGMDTLLVGISRGGDVVIYAGTDPSDPDAFGLKGTWNVGAVPAGRRMVTEDGGDVLVASSLGAIPLSKLVTGASATDSGFHATAKIASLLSRLMAQYRGLPGWALYVHPTEQALLLTYPTAAGSATSQLAMSYATRGWSSYRDLPILSGCTWDGEFYFGTIDGRVCKNTGYLDGVLLDNTDGTAVDWSVLPAFVSGGAQTQKRVQMIRLDLLADTATPTAVPTARYDFNQTEPDAPASESDPLGWDGGTWDSATWSGDFIASSRLWGATGMGRFVSVAVRGASTGRTTLVGMDVYFDQGGGL